MVCSGWWLVENEDKRLAWFPAPYLKLCDGEEEEEDEDEFDSPTFESKTQLVHKLKMSY